MEYKYDNRLEIFHIINEDNLTGRRTTMCGTGNPYQVPMPPSWINCINCRKLMEFVGEPYNKLGVEK